MTSMYRSVFTTATAFAVTNFCYVAKIAAVVSENCPAFHTLLFDHDKYNILVLSDLHFAIFRIDLTSTCYHWLR